MKLDDIDKDKIIKFPGRTSRDVKEERAKFNLIIKELVTLQLEKEKQPERSQAIIRGLKTEYSGLMARFVSQMLYLLEIKGDEEQFLDMVMSAKWDDIRKEFLEHKIDIFKKIYGILRNHTTARAAELGIRIVRNESI